MRCYPHFTLTRGRSPGFGSRTTDYSPSSDSLSLRLRLSRLNLACHPHSPVHSTKGTPSHFHAPTACRHTVSGSLSLRSRGAFHLSLTVLITIGRQGVFSLRRWSSQIPTGFLVSRGTWVPACKAKWVSPTGLSPSLVGLPRPFGYSFGFLLCCSVTALHLPAPLPPFCNGCNLSHKPGLGSSAFARHYLRNHACFLFLRVLRCFSSPGYLHMPMYSACSTGL